MSSSIVVSAAKGIAYCIASNFRTVQIFGRCKFSDYSSACPAGRKLMSGRNFRPQICEVQRATRESVHVHKIVEHVSVLFQAFSEFT